MLSSSGRALMVAVLLIWLSLNIILPARQPVSNVFAVCSPPPGAPDAVFASGFLVSSALLHPAATVSNRSSVSGYRRTSRTSAAWRAAQTTSLDPALRHPLQCQLLALLRAAEKLKIDQLLIRKSCLFRKSL